ncbi:hypothetical protein MHYP_G00069680 [Metynnis hypsauchen]
MDVDEAQGLTVLLALMSLMSTVITTLVTMTSKFSLVQLGAFAVPQGQSEERKVQPLMYSDSGDNSLYFKVRSIRDSHSKPDVLDCFKLSATGTTNMVLLWPTDAVALSPKSCPSKQARSDSATKSTKPDVKQHQIIFSAYF